MFTLMFENKKSLFVFQLKVLLSFMFLITSRGQRLDPIFDVCDDGVIDVIVRVSDGRVFLFKTDSYWEIDSKTFKIIENSQRRISEHWKNLPSNLDIGFTINTDFLDWANMSYRTIFVKNEKWFQFNDQNYERQGDITLWYKVNVGRNRWGSVITQFNDSITYLVINPNKPWDYTKTPEYLSFVFDDPDKPELFQTTILKGEIQVDPTIIRYLVPFPDGRFLLYFDQKYVGHFCVLQSITSQCNARLVSSLFECPSILAEVRSKNWVAKVWKWFGLDVQLFLTIVCGALITNVMILIQLIAVLFPRILTLKRYKNL